ncbi:hypothetical protein H1S01_19835, partial [Heliobacterium chlorum]
TRRAITIFGLNETLLSFLRRQVGLRTDASSATGSVHGKLGDIKDTSNANFSTINAALARNPWAAGKKTYAVYGQNYNNAASSTPDTDLFNITGPLLIIGGYIEFGSSSYVRYTLETDGTYWFNGVYGSSFGGSGGMYVWRDVAVNGGNHKSFAFVLPDPYLFKYTGTTSYNYETFSSNAIFTFPSPFYVEQRCRLTFNTSSSGNGPVNTRWGVYYIR